MQNSISNKGDNPTSAKQLGFSAAMDVIIIENPDGRRANSPFYVVFGSNKVRKCYQKAVDIYINNAGTGISMELNALGEGKLFSAELRKRKTTQAENLRLNEANKIFHQDRLDEMNNSAEIEEKKFSEFSDTSSDHGNHSFISDTQLNESEFFKLENNQLTTEQLLGLHLNQGVNIAHYVLRENPAVNVCGKIYFWNHNSKIVVTDIDGTLTKSDLLGILLFYFGRDWTRGGSVYFFNLLHQRGYKIIYLSARSFPQIEDTRAYLGKIQQGDKVLPDGPLLLNPSGLWESLMSEIKKKSKHFKENMLKNVLHLFPQDYNPFHAGIGNREGDATAYDRVGIPNNYTFIINKKGKEKGSFVSIKNFKDSKLRIDVFFPDLRALEEEKMSSLEY